MHVPIVILGRISMTFAKANATSNVIRKALKLVCALININISLVNINVYAKFHHTIPLSSRDSAIITFSEFGSRQSLDQ